MDHNKFCSVQLAMHLQLAEQLRAREHLSSGWEGTQTLVNRGQLRFKFLQGDFLLLQLLPAGRLWRLHKIMTHQQMGRAHVLCCA